MSLILSNTTSSMHDSRLPLHPLMIADRLTRLRQRSFVASVDDQLRLSASQTPSTRRCKTGFLRSGPTVQMQLHATHRNKTDGVEATQRLTQTRRPLALKVYASRLPVAIGVLSCLEPGPIGAQSCAADRYACAWIDRSRARLKRLSSQASSRSAGLID